MNRQNSIVRCRRPAMASLFEIWLAGEDGEHLSAVGEAALDEIVRIERLLSFFDPASEIARINREAPHRAVRIDAEVFAVLDDCRRWRRETDGYFDVTVGQVARPARTGDDIRSDRSGDLSHFVLDEHLRTVAFSATDVQINLGGYGKGYALDAAANVIREFGVASALLHGGTSSVLAVGAQPDSSPWKIGLRDPLIEAANFPSSEIEQVDLIDAGLSSSAAFYPGQVESDIMNPQQQQLLTERAACTVIAATATEGEVWSTALLAMGRSLACELLTCRRRMKMSPLRVAWLSPHEGRTWVAWLNEEIGE